MEHFVCAFTGHRPYKLPWGDNEKAENCIKLKEALAAQIEEMANAGTTVFFSGMARGTDYEKRKIMRSEALDAA